MAKKTGSVSGLAAKLGDAGRKAFEDHKNDEAVVPGGGEIPAGIENGIARLVMCKFGTYESGELKGEPYFMASAVVVEPKKLGKIPLTGLRTQIGPEPLCDTPIRTSRPTLDDHVAWVINQIKLLLGDDAENTEVTLDTVEAIAAALEESKPFIRFRTYTIDKRKVDDPKYNEQYDGPNSPPARVNQTWQGAVNYEESDDDTGVEDDTAEPEPKAKTTTSTPKKEVAKPTTSTPASVKGKKEVAKPTASATSMSPAKAVKGVKGKPPAPVEDIPFGDDLDMTADKADNGNVDAMEYLKTEAMKLNHPEENIDNTNNWGEVADMIRSGEFSSEEVSSEIDWDLLGSDADGGDQEAVDRLTALGNELGIDVNDHAELTWAEFATLLSDSANPEEEEEWKPVVDEVYKTVYMKGKPAVECQITAVDEAKQTVAVKNLNDKKPYKAIPWASLQQD